MHGISRSVHWGVSARGLSNQWNSGAAGAGPVAGPDARRAGREGSGEREAARQPRGSRLGCEQAEKAGAAWRGESEAARRPAARPNRANHAMGGSKAWPASARRRPPAPRLPRLDGGAAAAWQRPLSDSVPAEPAPFGARPKSDPGRRWCTRVYASTVVMPKQAETLQSPPPEGSTRRPLAGPPPREAASRSGCIPEYRADNIAVLTFIRPATRGRVKERPGPCDAGAPRGPRVSPDAGGPRRRMRPIHQPAAVNIRPTRIRLTRIRLTRTRPTQIRPTRIRRGALAYPRMRPVHQPAG